MSYSEGVSRLATYAYDAFGRRIAALPTGGTPTYFYYGINDGSHPEAEYTTAWQTDVTADGQLVATLDSSGNPTYPALDALGTTRQTVSGTGAASGIARYYPYEEAASVTSEYKWTNQQCDANGTDHFDFRHAWPALQSYASPSCGQPTTFAAGGGSAGSSNGGGYFGTGYADSLIWGWLNNFAATPISVISTVFCGMPGPQNKCQQ